MKDQYHVNVPPFQDQSFAINTVNVHCTLQLTILLTYSEYEVGTILDQWMAIMGPRWVILMSILRKYASYASNHGKATYMYNTFMKPIHATTVHLHETCTSTVTEKAIHSASSWNLYKQLKRLFIQHLHETYISNCVKAIHSASSWNLYKQLQRLFIQYLHENFTSNCKGYSGSIFMKPI